jgi:hypothetical protein
MVGIQYPDFSNDYMVAGLSTETNQKSTEIIGNTPHFRKMRPQTEFVFGPYLANGGGREPADKLSPIPNMLLNIFYI